MVGKIFLIRHGQTDSNITGFYMGQADEDLNETGYQQAQLISSRLHGENINTIYSSPLLRAYNTATAIGAPHEIKPTILPELTEINVGDWQEMHEDEISHKWPDLWHIWRTQPWVVRFPNGESFNDVTERVMPVFQKIAAENINDHFMIVAHEVVFKLIIANILHVSSEIYQSFEISNASVSILDYGNNGLRLNVLNDTSHLDIIESPVGG